MHISVIVKIEGIIETDCLCNSNIGLRPNFDLNNGNILISSMIQHGARAASCYIDRLLEMGVLSDTYVLSIEKSFLIDLMSTCAHNDKVTRCFN